ncbi:MAG TPA: response regulator [Tepidisphaeraceae bacterium]|jgi:CheY-like chemotaxis protein
MTPDITSGRLPRDDVAARALVVENDLTSRELLARVLRLKGLDAHTAIGAAQAAALLLDSATPYDLLIVDLNLEPVDGIELLRHVAVLPTNRRPRRIVAISESLAPFYPRLSELQMELEMFQKPVHLPSLMKIVEALG